MQITASLIAQIGINHDALRAEYIPPGNVFTRGGPYSVTVSESPDGSNYVIQWTAGSDIAHTTKRAATPDDVMTALDREIERDDWEWWEDFQRVIYAWEESP